MITGKRIRHLLFLLLSTLPVILLAAPWQASMALAVRDSRYNHIALVPLISVALIYLERKKIFSGLAYCPKLGLSILLCGVVLHLGAAWSIRSNDLTASGLALVVSWIGAFALCYGGSALRAARFPLAFLLLAVPIPVAAMDRISLAFQQGSAELCDAMFKLLGVPVFRQGFTFSMPGGAIQIGEECSGIRSGIAFIITGFLAGQVFLRALGSKVCFMAITVFAAVFKNAARIVYIALMGVYVDRDVLDGRFYHDYGGKLFTLLGVAAMVPVLLLLQKAEGKRPVRANRHGNLVDLGATAVEK